MPTVRDTIDPTFEREVSDEEALDLERMGLLLTGTRAKTPDGLRAAAIRQVTERLEGSDHTPAPAVAVGVGSPVESVGTHEDTADSVTETLDDQADTTEDDPEG